MNWAPGDSTINDYYVEDFVSWVRTDNPQDAYIPTNIERECGIRRPEGICECCGAYLLRANLPEVGRCLARRGFEPALPKYKRGYRIVDTTAELVPGYCLQLSPKNREGGISVGKYRLE